MDGDLEPLGKTGDTDVAPTAIPDPAPFFATFRSEACNDGVSSAVPFGAPGVDVDGVGADSEAENDAAGSGPEYGWLARCLPRLRSRSLRAEMADAITGGSGSC